MSPPNIQTPNPTQRFPRVSGDEPKGGDGNGTSPLFSPRERG